MIDTRTQVQCPGCMRITTLVANSRDRWDCPCGQSYDLRRCSGCDAVSHVSPSQQRDEPWTCVWCKAPNTGYTSRRDPATATLADLAHDMETRQLSLVSQDGATIPKTAPVLIVTTNEIPGYTITQVHGDVFGLIVRARNALSNLGASFRTAAGGEVASYTRLLTDSRNQARERMRNEARARGANAVVAMRFDCNEIGDIMSEIAAYGTAVTIEPVSPSQDASADSTERV